MRQIDQILLGHGAGGRLTRDLIESVFVPALNNPALSTLSDSALLEQLPPGRPALTTDAFVVDPLVFPGGDLGYLSVCGTVNDLAVAGARPLWLTWALILEEGLELDLLRSITKSAARAAEQAGIALVAGDTKVVPRGKGDRVYAVTAGLGVVPPDRNVGDHRVEVGDVVVASGTLGDHGATIMASRHGLDAGELRSDCAPLGGLIEHAFAAGVDIHAMHDPTRGGIATTCHEVSSRAGVRTELMEDALPIRPEVETTCELLGLDPLYLACEGRVVFWVAAHDADRLVEALRDHPLGRGAGRVGRVESRSGRSAAVVLHTTAGTERPIDLLSGIDLPRIC